MRTIFKKGDSVLISSNRKAYFDMRNIMVKYGFIWIQGSTYVTRNEDMSILFDLFKELSQTE